VLLLLLPPLLRVAPMKMANRGPSVMKTRNPRLAAHLMWGERARPPSPNVGLRSLLFLLLLLLSATRLTSELDTEALMAGAKS